MRRILVYFKRSVIALSVIVLVLLIARLCLPYFVLKYVNRVLNRLPEYAGSVEDVDIALIRGAYVIKRFRLVKRNGDVKQPFLSIPNSDLSIEWRTLFEGKVVGEIEVDNPTMNFVNATSARGAQTGTKGDWQEMIKDLFPVKINRFAVSGGKLTYRHEGTQDDESLVLTNLNGSIENLSNKPGEGKKLPSSLLVSGNFQEYSLATVKGAVNPLSKQPTFDIDLKVQKTPLPKLNKFLKKTLFVDAEGGTLEVYGEAVCRNGGFEGYIKPILKNVQISSLAHDGSNPLRLAWESLVSLVIEVFTNQRHDQFAFKIPLQGKLEKPDGDSVSALGSIIRNAYVQALKAKIDDSVEY